MARWLNMLELNCIHASREREFLDWYENTHFPDILKTPGYLSGRLYRMKEFRDGRGQFLTMYEIETDDIDETMALRWKRRLKEREQGRDSDLFIVIWRDVLWKLINECVLPKGVDHKGERWVNLVETNCVDPLREKEFNDWYDNIHLTDVLKTPGFQAAYRYEWKEFVGGRGKYLTIYAIGTEDIDKTIALRREKRLIEREQGRYTDLFMSVWRDVLWRLMIERTVS